MLKDNHIEDGVDLAMTFLNTFNNYSKYISIITRSTQTSLMCKGVVTFQDGAGNCKLIYLSRDTFSL
jgi:hypothetical protein